MSINREEIKNWVNENFQGNFTVDFNDQNEIIINGNCHLINATITELPYKFSKVNGNFNIGGHKFPREHQTMYRNLKTLKNCPDEITGDFSCHFCYNLESLKYGPKIVGGDYICSKCNLTSLDHIAKNIGGSIIIFGNFNLTDIDELKNIDFQKFIDLDFVNRAVYKSDIYKKLVEKHCIIK